MYYRPFVALFIRKTAKKMQQSAGPKLAKIIKRCVRFHTLIRLPNS